MKFITEYDLRARFSEQPFTDYIIEKNTRLTPVTFCKGLFNLIHRKFTFQGKKIELGTHFLDSWLISAIYIF